jgi:hypothetical protein
MNYIMLFVLEEKKSMIEPIRIRCWNPGIYQVPKASSGRMRFLMMVLLNQRTTALGVSQCCPGASPMTPCGEETMNPVERVPMNAPRNGEEVGPKVVMS